MFCEIFGITRTTVTDADCGLMEDLQSPGISANFPHAVFAIPPACDVTPATRESCFDGESWDGQTYAQCAEADGECTPQAYSTTRPVPGFGDARGTLYLTGTGYVARATAKIVVRHPLLTYTGCPCNGSRRKPCACCPDPETFADACLDTSNYTNQDRADQETGTYLDQSVGTNPCDFGGPGWQATYTHLGWVTMEVEMIAGFSPASDLQAEPGEAWSRVRRTAVAAIRLRLNVPTNALQWSDCNRYSSGSGPLLTTFSTWPAGGKDYTFTALDVQAGNTLALYDLPYATNYQSTDSTCFDYNPAGPSSGTESYVAAAWNLQTFG
jgi:hypothetical protein